MENKKEQNLAKDEMRIQFIKKLELMLNDIKNDFDKLTTHLLENTSNYEVNFNIGPEEYRGSGPMIYKIEMMKYANRKDGEDE